VALACLMLSRIENTPLPLESGDKRRFYLLTMCDKSPFTEKGAQALLGQVCVT